MIPVKCVRRRQSRPGIRRQGEQDGQVGGFGDGIGQLGTAFGNIGGVLGGALKLQTIIGGISLAPNLVPAVGSVVSAVG
jgi:hypothetical protein